MLRLPNNTQASILKNLALLPVITRQKLNKFLSQAGATDLVTAPELTTSDEVLEELKKGFDASLTIVESHIEAAQSRLESAYDEDGKPRIKEAGLIIKELIKNLEKCLLDETAKPKPKPFEWGS